MCAFRGIFVVIPSPDEWFSKAGYRTAKTADGFCLKPIGETIATVATAAAVPLRNCTKSSCLATEPNATPRPLTVLLAPSALLPRCLLYISATPPIWQLPPLQEAGQEGGSTQLHKVPWLRPGAALGQSTGLKQEGTGVFGVQTRLQCTTGAPGDSTSVTGPGQPKNCFAGGGGTGAVCRKGGGDGLLCRPPCFMLILGETVGAEYAGKGF